MTEPLTNRTVESNKTDIILFTKQEITWFIDVAITLATDFSRKDFEMIKKFCGLLNQIREVLGQTQVSVIPVSLTTMREHSRSQRNSVKILFLVFNVTDTIGNLILGCVPLGLQVYQVWRALLLTWRNGAMLWPRNNLQWPQQLLAMLKEIFSKTHFVITGLHFSFIIFFI